ncbi:MAG TPA: hypothetical protein VFI13_01630 [Gemmatimonadales bacterium]|nr:hypothetical protein [Gemmatimonadales bacterium]
MRGWVLAKGLTIAVTLIAWRLWGNGAALAAAAFALLATTIQYYAARIASKVPAGAPFAEFAKGWAWGFALRLAGVVVFVTVCTLWPRQFPALAVALGYLGVLIPLLFLETRVPR